MSEAGATNKYDPKRVEEKWITRWEEEGIYTTPEKSDKPKSYVLGMFPYPSGEGLHTGHGRIFTAVDVIARYQRMKGYDVLCPMGWDSFGLPAENAAIKTKKNPIDMVPHNEANFKRQMMSLALSHDWKREFSTTDPEYYKWTQWLFLKLYSIKNDKGERLVYRKETPINWCPFCKTGLANEEVLSDGTHERCGNKVEQKMMPQWNMRITDYADRLLKDIDETVWTDEFGKKRQGLDWPEGIRAMQRNWIGRREGRLARFALDVPGEKPGSRWVDVFTTRLDTINGVTFLVIAPELAAEWIESGWRPSQAVMKYVETSLGKPNEVRLAAEKEKTGVDSGIVAVNPANSERVPVWVADYVLGEVGSGAVMGVPAEDERDHEFAIRFGLPIKEVGEDLSMGVKSDVLTTYHMRDWVFSRQRYWGEPFPLVYCSKCGDDPTSRKATQGKETLFDVTEIGGKKYAIVPLPTDQLPLKLPYLASYEPTETGESPLARAKDWVKTTCPNCGGEARRETDTMPNWAGSCWYFLYFAKKNWDSAGGLDWEGELLPGIEEWCPVDWYIGGAEHAVLHLLYARFWTKAFADLGLIKFSEPFLRLRSVGIVLAADGRKMSKSLGNVVNPDDVVREFGADAVRIYEMFMGPWEQSISWNPRSLIGCRRLVEKIWALSIRDIENDWKESDKKLSVELSKLIAKVDKDLINFSFNTTVAAVMKFTNNWTDSKTGLSKKDMAKLMQIFAPIAPFVTEEIWEALGEAGSIHKAPFPKAEKVIEEEILVVVQVNGKTRGTIQIESNKAKVESEIKELALADEKVKKWVGEKYRVVFVPERLINFVTR